MRSAVNDSMYNMLIQYTINSLQNNVHISNKSNDYVKAYKMKQFWMCKFGPLRYQLI